MKISVLGYYILVFITHCFVKLEIEWRISKKGQAISGKAKERNALYSTCKMR